MTAVAPVLRKVAPLEDNAPIVERNALSWIVAHPHYLDRDDAPKREHFASPEGRELYDWIGLCREKSDPISPGDLALLVSEPSKAWLRWMTENPPSLGGSAAGLFAALAERHRRAEALRALDAGRHDLESGSPTADVAARVRDRLEAVSAPREASGIRFLTDAELDAPIEPPRWVVRGLGLCPGRPAVIVGMGYSGKSIFAALLALHVATGRRLLGQFACSPGPVTWLDYEMGQAATLRRLRRLCVGHGLDWAEARSALRLAPHPRVRMSDDDAEQHLLAATKGASLCVVDSLRRSCPGLDENDSRISMPLDTMARVSEANGCAFVVVHHATTKLPKDGAKDDDLRGSGRGSSAIFDASGSFIHMGGARGEPVRLTHVREPQDGRTFEAFYVEIRDVAVGADPKAGLRLDYLTEEQVNPPHDPARASRELERAVLAYVSDRPGCTRDAVCEHVQGRRTAVRAAVDELVRVGSIVERTGPKNSRTLSRGGA